MAEIRTGGPSWWSLLAVFMGIGIICWLAFTATKKTDDTNYSKGALHNETTTTFSPTYNANPLSFPPCGRVFTFDSGTPINEKPKVKK